MSYILDALRKSEHERQIAAGSGAGMLHPAMIDNYRKKGLKAPLLAGSALVVALSGALGWAFWPRSPLPPAARDAALTVERAPVAAPVNVTAPAPAPTRKASGGSAAAVAAATKPASEPPAKQAVRDRQQTSPLQRDCRWPCPMLAVVSARPTRSVSWRQRHRQERNSPAGVASGHFSGCSRPSLDTAYRRLDPKRSAVPVQTYAMHRECRT